MLRWREQRGQAAVELVCLLPLAAALLAAAWQAAVAGHAAWAAGAAAGAAARAAAMGSDMEAAAKTRLSPRLERGLNIRDEGDGTVQVAVRIPSVLGLPPLGRVTASAHFRPQQ